MLIYKPAANALSFGSTDTGSVAIFPGFSEVPNSVLTSKYAEFLRFFKLQKLLRFALKRRFSVDLPSRAAYVYSLEALKPELNEIWGTNLDTTPPTHNGESAVGVVSGIYWLKCGDTLVHFLIGLGASTSSNYLLIGQKIVAKVNQDASINWFVKADELLKLARSYPFAPRLSGYFAPCDTEPNFLDGDDE
ncbi:MAG: hypothetical protein WAX33_03900 [Rectinemataceae bacterium]